MVRVKAKRARKRAAGEPVADPVQALRNIVSLRKKIAEELEKVKKSRDVLRSYISDLEDIVATMDESVDMHFEGTIDELDRGCDSLSQML